MIHYLLCATPRSGSTLVAELLAQTGVAGIPNEHLLGWLPHRDRREAAFWLELLQRTVDAGATSNGVTCCKVMPETFEAAMSLLRAVPGGAGLDAWQVAERAFLHPRVVRVQRRDRLRQAISLAIAEATGVWHMARREGAVDPFLQGALTPRRDDHAADLPFDYDRIRAHQAGIDAGERYWDELFARHGVTAHVITYEEFIRDRRSQLAAILDFLGIAWTADQLKVDVHLDRLSNATNERFLALFRQEEARRR